VSEYREGLVEEGCGELPELLRLEHLVRVGVRARIRIEVRVGVGIRVRVRVRVKGGAPCAPTAATATRARPSRAPGRYRRDIGEI